MKTTMKRKMILFALISAVVAALIEPAHPVGARAAASLPSKQLVPHRASMSERVALHAAGRGNPWLNLSDGRDLPATYRKAPDFGQMARMDRARPTALASGDFDEDGVPDLLCGYAGPGGLITLHFGNVDSIFPNTPEALLRCEDQATPGRGDGEYAASPFLVGARVFDVPEPPDFIGAGDFDNDGHLDVVTAAAGSSALYFLAGDGRGALGKAQRIELPGQVTALATGEIGRPDGLADLAVAVVGSDGPRVLIFQGSDGVLKAAPEAIDLPAKATALAPGLFDDGVAMSLVIAAGSDLLIVPGADDLMRPFESKPARIDRRSFSFAIRSLALGDFVPDPEHRTDIALLADDGAIHLLANPYGSSATADGGSAQSKTEPEPLSEWRCPPVTQVSSQAARLVTAKVSCLATDDLVVLDGVDGQLSIVMAADSVSNGNAFSGSARLSVPVSLPVEGASIDVLPMRLNADALSDLVILRSGSSALSVVMSAAVMTFTVTNTGDSGPGSLRQAILDANANPGVDTINFSIGSGVQTISPASALPAITDPVTIDASAPAAFPTQIIELNGANAGKFVNGLTVSAGSSTVRGLIINRFTNTGILLDTNGSDVIEGNFIGVDPTGASELANRGGGLQVQNVPNNRIGGTTAAARNVLQERASPAIGIQGNFIGGAASGNVVQGNHIGCNAAGDAPLSLGGGNEVAITSARNNTIGGTTPGAGNIIAGGSAGVLIVGGSSGNVIQGNFIGTDITSTLNLKGNSGEGVVIFGDINNLIGGTADGAGNTIAFGVLGVDIRNNQGPGTGNAVLRNSIFSNAPFLGLDLTDGSTFGVTPNHDCGGAAGPNNLQNYPVVTSAASAAANTTIEGTLNSVASTRFRVEFFSNPVCDPSGFGQGKTFLGAATVTTAANCIADFTGNNAVVLAVSVAAGQFITSTATRLDAMGNPIETSEFSACKQLAGTVSVFDSCLRDDSSGNLFQFDSTTGDYKFTRCSDGFTLAGRGTITVLGGILYLSDKRPDRKVTAGLNLAQRTGSAVIVLIPFPGIYQTIRINFTNINAKCSCTG